MSGEWVVVWVVVGWVVVCGLLRWICDEKKKDVGRDGIGVREDVHA